MSLRPHSRPLPHRLSLMAVAVIGLMSHAASQAQAAGAAPAPAAAASTPPASQEPAAVVVVTGTRASLERARAIKRDSSVVQDSISATELGRFPDDNVADSLSHITGVSISRTAGGEGQYVSVRGLGPEYTLTTFNGRILGTDGAGRDFAFDVLPSDIINGADVVKSAQASTTEGAIGGLINLRSASPFDQKGQHGLLRVEGDRNLMTALNGKKLSATYSNTFGEHYGLLLGVVYAHRKERTDTAGNDGGWERNAAPSTPTAYWDYGNTWGGAIDPNGNGQLDPDEEGLIGPGQFRVGSIFEDKKRLALSGKFEWRPSDSLKVVVDGIKTRLDSPQVGYEQSYYPLFAPGRWSNMVVKNGVVTSFTMDNPDPALRLNPELLNKTSDRIVNTGLYGLNAEWKVNSDLTLTTDVYQSTSSRHSGGQDTYVVLRMNQPNTAQITLTGNQVPDVSVHFDDGRDLATGLANGQFHASDFNTHYFELSGDNVDDRIMGASEAGVLQIDKFHIDQLKFGANLTSRKKTRNLVDNDFNSGANYYSEDAAINVAALGGNIVNQHLSLPNFMNGVGGNFPRTFLGFDTNGYIAGLKGYDGQLRPDGSAYHYADAAPAWDPLQSYKVTERTLSAYLEADLSGEDWSADAGVRFVNTRTTSLAWDAKIVDLVELDQFNYQATYGTPTQLTQNGNYTYALPSVNYVWHITKPLQLRLGAAKTMARPSVDKLAPTSTTQSVAWGDFTDVFGGNAKLKPYSALQFDASLEWYYSKESVVSVAVYQKSIKNQITTTYLTGQDIGVPGHLFNVQMPINGDHASVYGIEFGLQHLWANGFGVRAQYTHNESKSYVDGIQQPLEGIAPATSSLGLLYEKGAWSSSVTADHTAAYVTNNNVLGGGFNGQAKAVTWLTAQLAYEINDHLRVSVEGRNLLDTKEQYAITNGTVSLPNGYYRYGRAFTLGLSLSL
ncbi:MAG: TonB-dependent receptor [Betaproteobacteria bacterium]